MKRYFFLTLLSFFALLGVGFYQIFNLEDSNLHVVFCNVGQGDGIYIKTPKGADIIVDGGPDESILSCLHNHMPLWDRDIELMVLSNADTDHYMGLLEVIQRFKVKKIAVSKLGKSDVSFESLEQEVTRQKIPVVTLTKGDSLKIGEIALHTLWPEDEYLFASKVSQDNADNKEKILGAFTTSGSVNQFSVVQQLTYKSFDVLLTGDITPTATENIDKLSFDRVEVLKIPHHGSKNGLTTSLLESVNPNLAVISAGKKNRYGHPHKETLAILQEKNIKTLRTDIDGEIEIVSDGEKWWVAN